MKILRSLLLPALLLATACQTHFLADNAVVIYDRNRIEDAEKTVRLLESHGVAVELQVRGPVPRKKSSIAVYDVSKHPDRPAEVEQVLAPVGKFEMIQFPEPKFGADIVIWLENESPE
jgi:hypothetical protein